VTRARWATLAQLAVSAALLAVLVQRVPLDDLREALARVRPQTFVFGLLLSLAAYLGRAQRWSRVLARAGVLIAPVLSYRLTLLGTFYGLVTPGRVGEFARALHVPAPRAETFSSVIWDRVADVLILELLCLPAFVLVPAWRGPLLLAWAAIVVFTAGVLWLMASPVALRAAARLLPTFTTPLVQWRDRSHGMLKSGVSGRSALWGLFFYLLTYPAAWLLLRDIAPGTSPLLLLGLPLLPLLGNLPIALGGLGLREQVSAAVFEQFGAGAANGAAFSLAWFSVVTLVPGLFGLVWSLAMPRQRRPRAESAE
jgi:uncharacterized membrane protein YbhN (UPF0104 family)